MPPGNDSPGILLSGCARRLAQVLP